MEEDARRFIREVWGLQGVAYVVVGLRYYSRIHTLGWRKLALDDALMLMAIIVYTAESVMAYLVVAYWKGLANNAMTDAQRAALDPASEEYTLRVNGSKTHVCGLLLYTTLLWLLKACWAVYYSRLTAGVHKMRRVVQGAYIVVPVTYVACLLVAFCKCIPFDRQWQINPDPGNNCMPAVSELQTVFVMVMNTLTDFYLMAISLPMVWKSNLPTRKKIVLFVMFGGGFLEMAFGILRCVSILTLGDIDPAMSGYWSVRESFVSVVLTNMPMVYPLVKRYYEKSVTTLSGTTANNELSGSNNTDESSNSYRLSNNNNPDGKRKIMTKNTIHPLSNQSSTIHGTSGWGSEDNMVADDDDGYPSKPNGAAGKERLDTGSSADEADRGLPFDGTSLGAAARADFDGFINTGSARSSARVSSTHRSHRSTVSVGGGRNESRSSFRRDEAGSYRVSNDIIVTQEVCVTEQTLNGGDGGSYGRVSAGGGRE
ncbi:hypothetical protein B0T19DRAFT_465018 [Cercophora scortea]|uniref:Rhodopsin domain-containing protein n=1 Tax=Cercophora scortea TaxID=314031 RepID=A0AAE0MAQ7_9PEZI|nr:hypothetical protein B0T19DRAFT_465018 [Cercophora scortea]